MMIIWYPLWIEDNQFSFFYFLRKKNKWKKSKKRKKKKYKENRQEKERICKTATSSHYALSRFFLLTTMIGGVGVRMSCLLLPYLAGTPLHLPCFRPFHYHRRIGRLFSTSCSSSSVDKREKVIVISGPTGAGKSKLALELAKLLNGEIISADSVQVQVKQPYSRISFYLLIKEKNSLFMSLFAALKLGRVENDPSIRDKDENR